MIGWWSWSDDAYYHYYGELAVIRGRNIDEEDDTNDENDDGSGAGCDTCDMSMIMMMAARFSADLLWMVSG